MKLVDWSEFLKNGLPLDGKKSSVTVGVFDGVHRGHQALIERVVSHNADFVPVVITFKENHKRDSVKIGSEKTSRRDAETQREEREIFDIISFEKKTKILEELGVEILLVIDFTEEFRHMRGVEFLEILMERGNVGFFAVGSGFRCGYKLDTDAAAIQKFFEERGVPAEIAPEVMEDGLPISSSRIRAAIAAGEMELAERMMGRA
jgi:riboflavin kinase/FMN adenylyltransferase